MGWYVEVMCDVRKPGMTASFHHKCDTHAGNNPQGVDKRSAKQAAIAQGWIFKGKKAICPGCQKESP